jgi:endonuclease/exonuclease/phosphatase family metal-dependent hydrolase
MNFAFGQACLRQGVPYGNAILARPPITRRQSYRLPVARFMEPRQLLAVTTYINGCPLTVWCTHLSLLPGIRAFQARHIVDIVEGDAAPVQVLAGDLNIWHRRSLAARILDRHFAGLSPSPTFPARYPLLGLDQVLVRPGKYLSAIRNQVSALTHSASDHLPLVAKLQVPALSPSHGK